MPTPMPKLSSISRAIVSSGPPPLYKPVIFRICVPPAFVPDTAPPPPYGKPLEFEVGIAPPPPTPVGPTSSTIPSLGEPILLAPRRPVCIIV
ncbi:unnamed protein product [Schistosoma mattheei]|uniref:Uncharacterized protein n=1 Tax=Schistosoma mattheei TaxID=31246 RepID=A0A183Q135_9TREM|nr:unnamed protein product [Schistosoma mattheei]